ncbi:hypothetical protein CaCOL14_007496 [Colletotrichum acutatum]
MGPGQAKLGENERGEDGGDQKTPCHLFSFRCHAAIAAFRPSSSSMSMFGILAFLHVPTNIRTLFLGTPFKYHSSLTSPFKAWLRIRILPFSLGSPVSSIPSGLASCNIW